MSGNDATVLARIREQPIRPRVAFALAVAQMVERELPADSAALTAAHEALRLSWNWVAGASVKGADIDPYIDSQTDNNLMRHILRCPRGPAYAALTVTMQAVAYAGRKAYDAEGAKRMSDPMWQVDESILDDLMSYALETSQYNEAAAQRIVRFLADRYTGQGPETLGGPITVAEVLPLISAP